MRITVRAADLSADVWRHEDAVAGSLGDILD
jgi:hypothetical protein